MNSYQSRKREARRLYQDGTRSWGEVSDAHLPTMTIRANPTSAGERRRRASKISDPGGCSSTQQFESDTAALQDVVEKHWVRARHRARTGRELPHAFSTRANLPKWSLLRPRRGIGIAWLMTDVQLRRCPCAAAISMPGQRPRLKE